jgi:hypothetical protein
MDFRKGLLNFVVLNKIIFWLSMWWCLVGQEEESIPKV